MSGFNRSQFIKSSSKFLNKQIKKHTLVSSNSIELPTSAIQKNDNGSSEKVKSILPDKQEKSLTLPIPKLKPFGHYKKFNGNKYSENIIKKRHHINKKEKLKESIEKMQSKIDELSDVIKTHVSVNDDRSQINSSISQSTNIITMKNVEENGKNTARAIFIIFLIILYNFAIIFLMDDHDFSPRRKQFSVSETTQRKSLLHYLLNISAE